MLDKHIQTDFNKLSAKELDAFGAVIDTSDATDSLDLVMIQNHQG